MAAGYDPETFTDVDGHPVDDAMAGWAVFIALHLDEDEWFTDTELVEDALLALGYRNSDQRRELARDGSDHLLGVDAALDRLVQAGLVLSRTTESTTGGEMQEQFRLAKQKVDSLNEVTIAIGTVWGVVGTDTVDTKAEFGWLLLIAMRIHDADRQGWRGSLKKRLGTDALFNEIQSLFVTDKETIDALVVDLDRKGFIDWEKGNRFTGRDEGYELDEVNGWGGVYSLRDKLIEAFGVEPLRDTDGTPPERTQSVLTSPERPESLETTDLAWTMLEIVREAGTPGINLGAVYDQIRGRYGLLQDYQLDKDGLAIDELNYEEAMSFVRVALQYPTQAIRIVRSPDPTQDYRQHRCHIGSRGNKVTRKELGYAIEQNMGHLEQEKQDIAQLADRRYLKIPSIAAMANAIISEFEQRQGSEEPVWPNEINRWLVANFKLEPETTNLPSLRPWDHSELEFFYRSSVARLHLYRQGRLRRSGTDDTTLTHLHGNTESEWGYMASSAAGDLPFGERFLFDDHQEWAWATLEEIRDLAHQSTAVEVSGARVSTRVAERLGISLRGRTVRSKVQESIREYVIRCIVMCETLASMNLVRPNAERQSWYLTAYGQHITRSEFDHEYNEVLHLDNIAGEYGWYRGDTSLEVTMQSEDDEESISNDTEVLSYAVDDIDLCLQVLRVLAGAPAEHQGYLPEADLFADVSATLVHVPQSYLNIPAPPWITKTRGRSRPATFFEYRMEHVLRALSTHQVALIHTDDPYTVDDDEGWAISQKGREVLAADDDIAKSALTALVDDYFGVHAYEDWHTEAWMTGFIAHVQSVRARDGINVGYWFELLCCDILKTEIGAVSNEEIKPEPGNAELDRQGIDILVPFRPAGSAKAIESQLGRQMAARGDNRHLLLVQCKCELTKETDEQPAGKLFGIGARLRSHAWRGEVAYGVLGGLLITLGDLSCEAEWSFWATHAAWQSWDDELAMSYESMSAEHDTRQQNLRFELWDGGKILRLMKERQIGVTTDHLGESRLNRSYLEGLFKKAHEEAAPEKRGEIDLDGLFEKTDAKAKEIKADMEKRARESARTGRQSSGGWRTARQR